jgi:hypothetical protein
LDSFSLLLAFAHTPNTIDISQSATMGLKGVISLVSALFLSSIIENASGLAIQTATPAPSVSVIPKVGPLLSERAVSNTPDLVGISKSTLGEATNDPTLRTSEAFYWGRKGKK